MRRRGGFVDEAVAAVGGVVCVAETVDAVQIRMAFRRRVHHACQIVHPADMRDALLDGLAIVVHPLDEDVSRGDVVALTPAASAAVALFDDMADVQRGEADFQRKGGLEGGLGLAVEVDAELLEGGGVGELRVDARGGVLEEGELGEVALGAVEELVSPGALEGGDLRGGKRRSRPSLKSWIGC